MPRTKKKSTRQVKEADRKRKAEARQDPEYRAMESASHSLYLANKRQDPNYKEKERAENKERQRQARQDPEYRAFDSANHSFYIAAKRQDPNYKDEEREENKERQRQARQDPEFRAKEKELDTPRKRKYREDNHVRTLEKTRDRERRKVLRNELKSVSRRLFQDAESNCGSKQVSTEMEIDEQDQNSNSEKSLHTTAIDGRESPKANEFIISVAAAKQTCSNHKTTVTVPSEKQLSEPQPSTSKNNNSVRTRNSSNKTLSTFNIQKDYLRLREDYFKAIRQSPNHVCSSCGGLFYKVAVSKANINIIPNEILRQVICVEQTQHEFCVTCKNSIKKKKVPRLCLSNGFRFPTIPQVLQDLSPLESRLVALRIPFMQIKLMGAERQSILKGNVVNIENDLDVCTSVIPRTFDNTSTVQVQLMRRLTDKTPYMYETIRPAKVYAAARYLMETPLYKSVDVVLSRTWENSSEEDTVDFICEPNDTADPEECNEIQISNTDTQGDGVLKDKRTTKYVETTEIHDNSEDAFIDFMVAEECLVLPQGSNLGLRIAPGQGKYPVPLFADTKAEEMSFPTIYCGIPRLFDPALKVSYTDIAKSEIRRHDRRACVPTKLLYSFKKSFNEKLRSAVQIHLRKRTNKMQLKAKDVRTKESIQSMMRTDESYTSIWSNLRSSPAYWSRKQKLVMAMLRQLGKCHFFITLSAAESKWNELLVTLSTLVNNKTITEEEASSLSKEEKRQLIRADPVTCMRHFDHKHRHLLNKLLIPRDGVFTEKGVSDYFTRLEFQMRGSPHSHGLYWINNAPEYIEGDADSEQEVINFIDSFITCGRSQEPSMQEVLRYQVHKHSTTCYKKCKSGKVCRFGFPKPPLPNTRILHPLPKLFSREMRKTAAELYKTIQADLTIRGRDPKNGDILGFNEYLKHLSINEDAYIEALRSSIERTTVFLKRAVDEAFINAYNPSILTAWGANMDIQFVLDTYACAKYCVGYILKSDGGMSKLMKAAAASIRKGNLSLQQKIQKYAGILVNSSEISAQEAAAYLLGIANTRSSRSEVFINTAPSEERTTILRPQEELDSLDDESEDICVKGLLDHYAKRPECQESICLASFAAFWTYSKSKKVNRTSDSDEFNDESMERQLQQEITGELQMGNEQQQSSGSAVILELKENSGYIHSRKKAKVIRFVHYGRQQDPVNYWREQLLLFVPWRDENEFSGDTLKVAQENLQVITINSKPFYYNRDIDENILGELLEQQRITEEENDGINNDDNILGDDEQYLADVFLEGPDQSNKIEAFLPPKQLCDKDYYSLMRSLNDKQRRFVLNILNLVKTSQEPFYHFLSGGAGVGKSHAIKAIVQSITRYQGKQPDKDPSKIAVVVAAPTGMAAYNVSGMTIHTAFRILPVQNNEQIGSMSDSLRNTLYSIMQDVELIIVDEVSMMVLKMFFEVNSRLQEIFDIREDFARKSMLVVGHLRQLSPIGGRRVFEQHAAPQYTGNHLWPKFRLFELTEIMRQRGQLEFCKALNNMSEGLMDEEDISLLRECTISEANQPPKDAIWLFKTNKQCQDYNNEYFKTLDGEGFASVAVDTLEGSGTNFQRDMFLQAGKTLNHMQSDGLPASTFLKVGGKYFVSTNIKVSDGLFNGSHGTLKYIECNANMEPVLVWMDFTDPNNGQEMRRQMAKLYQSRPNIDRSWTPIRRMRRKLSYKQRGHNLRIVRLQIPLVACNGMTVAKSQGSSLPAVVLNVEHERGTEKLKTEELYVGCSRATSKEGLFIKGEFVPPPPYKPDHPVTKEMERLRALGFPMKLRFLQDVETTDCTKVYFHNVQSFNLHKADVAADPCPLSADILIIVEPHTLKNDDISLSGFQVAFRKDCLGNRHDSSGILVFVKESFARDKNQEEIEVLETSQGPGIDIVVFKILNCTYIVIYRSPSSSTSVFIAKLKDMLTRVEGNFLVLGDINIDLCLDIPNGPSKKFLQLMEGVGAKSLTDLQEYSTDGKSHIDVAFSNSKNVISWYYESYYSYHKPICSVLST